MEVSRVTPAPASTSAPVDFRSRAGAHEAAAIPSTITAKHLPRTHQLAIAARLRPIAPCSGRAPKTPIRFEAQGGSTAERVEESMFIIRFLFEQLFKLIFVMARSAFIAHTLAMGLTVLITVPLLNETSSPSWLD